MPISYREKFFSGPFAFMQDVLTGLWAEREAISQNIANANNPNYHPVHVKFKDQLEQIYNDWWAAHGDNPDGLGVSPVSFDFDEGFEAENNTSGGDQRVKPQYVRDPVGKVDINYEMGLLYKNQMLYNITAENNRPVYGRDVLDIMLK